MLLCTIGICYCDRRVQEDISSADTSALLRSIQAMEVKQFVYKYPQFYNPVFGEKQIGFVAQELAEVPDLPQSAIGRVKKRTVEKDVHLEDLHVVNQDAIFIANVGVGNGRSNRESNSVLAAQTSIIFLVFFYLRGFS